MSKQDLKIDIHHVTRVEGHGNIVVNSRNGTVNEIRWEIPESPRFFEAMLKGRNYNEVAHITSRICAICSTGHTLASLKATEDAFKITPTQQTWLLRKLLSHGQCIQSHILHVCFLVLPDLLDADSVIPLAETHPDAVKLALKMKKLGNDIADIVGGRAVHPITACVGGFTKMPNEKELINLREKLTSSISDLKTLVTLVKSLAGKIPNFSRKTEFISLKWDKQYSWIDGDIYSSETGKISHKEYLKITNEFIIPYSTAKRSKNKLSSYMVGALARVNNNFNQLTSFSKEAAETLGFKPICCNPFMNNIAQVVETVHCVEDSIAVINELLKVKIKEEPIKVSPKAGRGIGAIEVPRGILFHDYTYDENGNVLNANLVIPTNQNHANIEDDMKAWVPTMLKDEIKEENIAHNLEMLVRAYDPCISCSTHMLNVKFK
ncbi:MAG: Ni/Fe hydrogenase subunit alpha [Planctomycetota bacterium]